MKNLLIPSILGATLVIALAFSIMPVQKASTINSAVQNIARDNVVINNINVTANQRLIIVDNFGIGGLSDVEITMRNTGGDPCTIQVLTGGAWTSPATAPFPVTVVGELTVPVHVDVANVDAVGLLAGATNCILGTTNEYISVSTVGT